MLAHDVNNEPVEDFSLEELEDAAKLIENELRPVSLATYLVLIGSCVLLEVDWSFKVFFGALEQNSEGSAYFTSCFRRNVLNLIRICGVLLSNVHQN